MFIWYCSFQFVFNLPNASNNGDRTSRHKTTQSQTLWFLIEHTEENTTKNAVHSSGQGDPLCSDCRVGGGHGWLCGRMQLYVHAPGAFQGALCPLLDRGVAGERWTAKSWLGFAGNWSQWISKSSRKFTSVLFFVISWKIVSRNATFIFCVNLLKCTTLIFDDTIPLIPSPGLL